MTKLILSLLAFTFFQTKNHALASGESLQEELKPPMIADAKRSGVLTSLDKFQEVIQEETKKILCRSSNAPIIDENIFFSPPPKECRKLVILNNQLSGSPILFKEAQEGLDD